MISRDFRVLLKFVRKRKSGLVFIETRLTFKTRNSYLEQDKSVLLRETRASESRKYFGDFDFLLFFLILRNTSKAIVKTRT